MRKLFLPSSRPLCFIVLYFIIGIISGHIGMTYTDMPLFYLVILGCFSISIPIIYHKNIAWAILGIAILFGYLSYMYHPVNQEAHFYNQYEMFIGTIKEVEITEYETRVILEEISIPAINQKLGTNVLVVGLEGVTYKPGNIIKIYGQAETIKSPMNPSDFDYKNYLKGKGIITEIEPYQIEVISSHEKLGNKVKEVFINQISKVFNEETTPLITKMLVGEDRGKDEVSEAYYNVGIGHLLAISGLHIGIIFGLIWFVLGLVYIPYTGKVIIALLIIWAYTFMIGLNISAVRASFILSIIYGGRILFEEEDEWIAVAISACVLLIQNPFQLFQVGFQLSFLAYIGILLSNLVKSKIHLPYIVLLNIVISWMTWPIIAWHFYEIPIIGFLLNFVVVPLFGMIIPLALVAVLVSFPLFHIGAFIAFVTEQLLDFVWKIVVLLESMPIGTWVTGKPSIGTIITVYMVLGIGIVYIQTERSKRQIDQSMVIMMGLLIMPMIIKEEKELEIMHLYVGQGDSCVIITPTNQTIVIDGGNKGSEKTIANYLKYKGHKIVDLAIVSHPHADHIAGMIGLFDEGITIKEVIAPTMNEPNEWQDQLEVAIAQNDSHYVRAQSIDKIILDEVEIAFIYPKKVLYSDNENNASVVCQVNYRNYSQLFTGDIEHEAEMFLLPILEPIDVLKVAHHGSSTSTTELFLDKVAPQVAVISCGINNWYNHPSGETLETLIKREIDYYRTDLKGATWITSDGEGYQVESYQ